MYKLVLTLITLFLLSSNAAAGPWDNYDGGGKSYHGEPGHESSLGEPTDSGRTNALYHIKKDGGFKALGKINEPTDINEFPKSGMIYEMRNFNAFFAGAWLNTIEIARTYKNGENLDETGKFLGTRNWYGYKGCRYYYADDGLDGAFENKIKYSHAFWTEWYGEGWKTIKGWNENVWHPHYAQTDDRVRFKGEIEHELDTVTADKEIFFEEVLVKNRPGTTEFTYLALFYDFIRDIYDVWDFMYTVKNGKPTHPDTWTEAEAKRLVKAYDGLHALQEFARGENSSDTTKAFALTFENYAISHALYLEKFIVSKYGKAGLATARKKAGVENLYPNEL
ncbi:hypothetical protein [Mariprofundus sp. KV]|uniref:hypothetical protein n=1 Tax=Mariprofundus sp. KV TaxID=2608715 RepID=UPI0015A3B01F|nr:hypothetical protein [Mariprofundus sp. KV]NWF35173.1 hypothetical protein [Mariprofundus sp. KV]